MSRSTFWVWAIAVVVGMLAASFAPWVGTGASVPSASSPAPVAPSPSLLERAAASLNAEDQRGSVGLVHCQVQSADTGLCSDRTPSGRATAPGTAPRADTAHRLTPAGVGSHPTELLSPSAAHSVGTRPADAISPRGASLDAPGWFNITGNITDNSATNYGTTLPQPTVGSPMAYDPLLQEVVLFVGCSVTACATNETWAYTASGWQNLTGTLTTAPSPRSFAAMDFDPALGGLVLVGGADTSVYAYNDTWLFNGTWWNLTAQLGYIDTDGEPGGIWGGSLAWDPQTGGLLLVDGCLEVDCLGLTEIGATWYLNGTSPWSLPAWGPGTDYNYTYLGLGSMAYDQRDAAMLWFGGYDAYAGTVNYTFTYTPATGWVNVTDTDGGCLLIVCSLTPAGRYGAGMTWDGQYGAIFLVGGYNGSSGEYYNDSWIFTDGVWVPLVLLTPTPSAFAPIYSPSLAVNSSGIAPFLVGGSCALVGCAGNEWTWEIPPAPSVADVDPNPVDNGSVAEVNVTRTPDGGSGPTWAWSVSYGDGTSTNFTTYDLSSGAPFYEHVAHTYNQVGNYSVAVRLTDFFTLAVASAAVNVTVNASLSALATASPAVVDLGQSVRFAAVAYGGIGPYNFSWDFNDGSPASASANTTHTYTTAGTYHATLTVTDRGGGFVTIQKTLVVNPALIATVAATPSSVTTGATVTFSVTATGGSGTYTYSWLFGDGSAGSALVGPTHMYAVAGTYTARVWVNDSLGSSIEKNLTVTVTAPSSGTTSGSGFPGGALTWIIVAVVVVLVAIAALALVSRRRRTRSPPPPSSPTAPPSTGSGPPPGAM